jgi:1,2-diacylglycerol 3-beta-galactosyltransferase
VEGEAEVLVLIVDAGGGHRAVANALVAASSGDGALRLRVESLQDVLESTDFVRKLFGISIEGAYNFLIRKNLTRVLVPLLRVLHVAIRVRYRVLLSAMERRLRSRPPALVVSLAPHFNGIIRDALRRIAGETRFLVLLTDYADFPPHFWMERELDHVVVGSRSAEAQAKSLGIKRVSRVSGMCLHPRFYGIDRERARKTTRGELGIPEEAKVLLVLFGGWGSPEIAPLCEALLEERPDWHIVAIAGKNPGLETRLRSLAAGSQGRLHGTGFTNLVAEFMAASDLLLTKPGPGTIAEALHLGLPMVVVSSGLTVPQERFNARFLVEEGLGSSVSHFRKLPREAARLFEDGGRALGAIKDRIAQLPENRAVYQTLSIFSEEAGLVGGRYS